jgi:alkanesulfonate monooxygenase SsuD/methylene tetrahydromethanopterin reductase-like flavin-dependent oxidoreductase (luciferase family)
MRIGVSISSTHAERGPQLMIERARVAYASGLASLTIGDHHNMGVPYAQNTPMLGRLLAEWPDRPAGCLFLVPLWNPLLMAEQIGTLSAMHDDTFIVQAAIGFGADQFAAFGTTERARARRLEEAIPVVKRLLAGEVVDSEFFDMAGGRVGLRSDKPIEWWVGAGVDAALERAARLGDVWYASPGNDVAAAADRLERFRSLGGTRAAIRKDVLVLADRDLARATADATIASGYRGLTRSQLIVGNADDAAEQLAPYFEVGFEEVVVRCMSGPQEQALETLELLGTLSS